MKTYQERLITGLTRLGYTKCLNEKSKYVSFYIDGGQKLFIGKSGALRIGDCASNSRSIGDPSRQTKLYAKVLDAAGFEG